MQPHPIADHHYVILPDGRLEPAQGRIPADVPIEDIVFPRVSTNVVLQARYENSRLAGVSHDEAFVYTAKRYARMLYPKGPFQDGDTIEFRTQVHRRVADDIETQAKYSAIRVHLSASHGEAKKWVTKGMIFREADFTEWLTDENTVAFRDLLSSGPGKILDTSIGDTLWMDRGESADNYCNGAIPLCKEAMTVGELVGQGLVIEFNFAPIFPLVSRNLEAQARYRAMRINGQSHKMAEMLATRSFPGVRTDTIFNEGKFSGESNSGCNAKELWLRKEAERVGFSTNGLWYCSGLAEYPGDPRAWIGSMADAKKLAEERNYTMDGYVSHKGREVAPKDDLVVDPALIEAEVREILDENPWARRDDVYNEVYDCRTGRVDKNPLVVQEPTQDWG